MIINEIEATLDKANRAPLEPNPVLTCAKFVLACVLAFIGFVLIASTLS